MRLKALKGLPSPGKVSRSSSVAVSPPDMQWRWVAGSWAGWDMQHVHLCPRVLMQQSGLYHGPIWKLGQPEHLPLQGAPCWVCGPVQTRQTCIKPCCSVSSMFLPLYPSMAALGFPHHLWAADVYSMAVQQRQSSFPTQPSWLGCENVPSHDEGPTFASGVQCCIRISTSEQLMHFECTPCLYWHSLNWWTPLVLSSCQSKSWLCTKLGLRN